MPKKIEEVIQCKDCVFFTEKQHVDTWTCGRCWFHKFMCSGTDFCSWASKNVEGIFEWLPDEKEEEE